MSESYRKAGQPDTGDRSGPERREMIGGSCRRAPVDHEANEHRAETHRRLALLAVERLAGAFLRPLPLEFGRFRYRSGFVARRSDGSGRRTAAHHCVPIAPGPPL